MDLYERLGVRRAAGGAEIRRAWQRLSRALHPAVNPGDPTAPERYREAARAFEILADPQRRAASQPPCFPQLLHRGRARA